jgi:hypothetical protein
MEREELTHGIKAQIYEATRAIRNVANSNID